MPATPNPPDLPEPEDLQAEFSAAGHDLDWGDPVPTRADIVAEFGPEATAASFTLLRRLLAHHDEATRQFLHAIRSGDVPHELDHRIKSPQSLARKLWKYRHMQLPVDDVLRYTVVTEHPDRLIDSARETVARLAETGWQVQSAHQSYVDGSRYKGIHAIMRTATGTEVEVQFHSVESIQVKTRTTGLYHVERDPTQPKTVRAEATAEAVRLSAAMRQPAGLDAFTELGGCRVEARRYGSSDRRPPRRTAAQSTRHPARGVNPASERTNDNGRTT
ncbi:hypothetical protein Kfla_5370 [Kribbella flavida DSM 17836]|uniref:RelA/SpoT domain-containing protein n=1 Tax=Kribbella flavida (strain DSM 17836 / JCM 10339 / NBRC 14399) TaxID=479435 RepID=D2PM15_KRIFD|nr:hypothetical protein [Kribbella flavida]ADB34383.1 hypothetical protein Kfla_5370 [Kribbella flavida DSM 17836]